MNLEALEKGIIAAAKSGDQHHLKSSLNQLLLIQADHQDVAFSLLRVIATGCADVEQSLAVLTQIFDSHKEDPLIVAGIGSGLEFARDLNDLNMAPPGHPLFQNVVECLSQWADQYQGSPNEEKIVAGLCTATRMLGRQHDKLAARTYARLVELNPESSGSYYRQGLWCKTRGHFQAGMVANQKAISLANEAHDASDWNLGICATGAGDAEVALDVWKRIGQKVAIGRFGLPDGSYPQCKVKLAQFPLSERTATNDSPGKEETIWIERLSPCHGIVRSVLYFDLGVNYGDVILMDGAPITYHTQDKQRIPVFPHLATLHRNAYQFFDFAGTQEEADQLQEISDALAGDALVYSHSENFRLICNICWHDPEQHQHEHEKEEKQIIRGRIAAPPQVKPQQLLEELDSALAERSYCNLHSPELCAAAGADARIAYERHRYDLLVAQDD